jgi:membrane associated rhomboid family serine protease
MSFLRMTSSLVGRQRCHLSPIEVVFIRNTRNVELNPRITSPTLQQLRRPFSTSLLRLSYFQPGDRGAPLRQRKLQQLQDELGEPDRHDEDSVNWKPPPRYFNAPNIVVGSMVRICIGMFGYSQLVRMEVASKSSLESIAAMRALNAHFVHSPENIITSAFMHSSVIHLLVNMIGLWSFGRLAASIFGAPSFLVLYFGSIITGGLAQNYVWEQRKQSNIGGVGASGGVLGVFAAMACIMPRRSMTMLFVPMPM